MTDGPTLSHETPFTQDDLTALREAVQKYGFGSQYYPFHSVALALTALKAAWTERDEARATVRLLEDEIVKRNERIAELQEESGLAVPLLGSLSGRTGTAETEAGDRGGLRGAEKGVETR